MKPIAIHRRSTNQYGTHQLSRTRAGHHHLARRSWLSLLSNLCHHKHLSVHQALRAMNAREHIHAHF
uniref:Uncharacterized protein n=1 Tax=Arundo donax TaxID=35708 RepID=A0A0A9BD93_ARUDO